MKPGYFEALGQIDAAFDRPRRIADYAAHGRRVHARIEHDRTLKNAADRGDARYRLMLFRTPAGPWRTRRADALRDALRARMATREEIHANSHASAIFLFAGAWIETQIAGHQTA